MNIQKLREVVNLNLPDDVLKRMVYFVIADDGDAINDILGILHQERSKRHELIIEMNSQLSRAHVALEIATFDKKGLNGDRFVEREITKFYVDHKDQVSHCYKDVVKIEEDLRKV